MKRGLWEKLPPYTCYLLDQERSKRYSCPVISEWYTSEDYLHPVKLTEPGLESYCISVEDYLKGKNHSSFFVGAVGKILDFKPRSEL